MARRRAQMSQRELAGRLGCRQATIARWERGDRQPSYEDVREVADACGLQLDAHLLPEDRSWLPQIAMQLERSPSLVVELNTFAAHHRPPRRARRSPGPGVATVFAFIAMP